MPVYCTASVVSTTLQELTSSPVVRMLEACGFKPKVETSGAQFSVHCPCCGGRSMVTGDRVSCKAGCELQDTRLITLLCSRFKGSYGDVRKHLERHITGLRDKPRWKELSKRYFRQAATLHWLARLARGDVDMRNDICMYHLTAWCEKNGYDKLVREGRAVYLDKRSTVKLQMMENDAQDGTVPVMAGETLAIFYWVDSATPSAVVLASPDHATTRLDFMPFSTACTGLNMPSATRTLWHRMAPVLDDALTGRNDCWIKGHGTMGINAPCEIEDTGNPTDWPDWGRLSGSCPQCTIRGRSFADYVKDKLLVLTEHDHWPKLASALVDCIPLLPEQFGAIGNELVARNRMHSARSLKACLATATVWSDNKWLLKRTVSGYVGHEKKTASDRALTNFCLTPMSNIVFPETSEVLHRMTLDTSVSSLVVDISNPDLHTPAKLQDALRLQTARVNLEGQIPAILDNGPCAKLLMPWLRKRASEMPQQMGRAMLGWSPERDVFQAASWRLTMDGITENEVCLKVSLPALACFTSSHRPSVNTISNLSQPARDIIAVIAGMMARYYVRSRVRAVCIHNSNPARQLCKAVFNGLGQTRELELGVFRNVQLQGVNGHPVLATGFNAMQADAANIPAVILAETGYNVTSFDERGASHISGCARWVLQRVAEWLMATEGKEFSEVAAFRYILRLMEEGSEVIRHACKVEEWEITAPELPYLQRLVAGLGPEDASRRFALLDESRIRVNTTDGPNAEDLAVELLVLGIASTRDETGSLIVPAAPLMTLLQDYWNATPMLAVAMPQIP